LVARLASRAPAPRGEAALVIGAGMLPYIFGLLSNVVQLHDVDLYRTVLETSRQRIEELPKNNGWKNYHGAMDGNLARARFATMQDRDEYAAEASRASRSGLAGNYDTTRDRAGRAEVLFHEGNICDLAPQIGGIAVRSELEFGFVNVTNVVEYLEQPIVGDRIRFDHKAGIIAMYKALCNLNLAPDAVIIDSYQYAPQLYTPAEYRRRAQLAGAVV